MGEGLGKIRSKEIVTLSRYRNLRWGEKVNMERLKGSRGDDDIRFGWSNSLGWAVWWLMNCAWYFVKEAGRRTMLCAYSGSGSFQLNGANEVSGTDLLVLDAARQD